MKTQPISGRVPLLLLGLASLVLPAFYLAHLMPSIRLLPCSLITICGWLAWAKAWFGEDGWRTLPDGARHLIVSLIASGFYILGGFFILCMADSGYNTYLLPLAGFIIIEALALALIRLFVKKAPEPILRKFTPASQLTIVPAIEPRAYSILDSWHDSSDDDDVCNSSTTACMDPHGGSSGSVTTTVYKDGRRTMSDSFGNTWDIDYLGNPI